MALQEILDQGNGPIDEDPGWQDIKNFLYPKMHISAVRELLREKRERLHDEGRAKFNQKFKADFNRYFGLDNTSKSATVVKKTAKTTKSKRAERPRQFQRSIAGMMMPKRRFVLLNRMKVSPQMTNS